MVIAIIAWMNSITSWNAFFPANPRLRDFRKQGDITAPSPSMAWVFIDENPNSINDGWFACDPNNLTLWYDIPATYHSGAGGLSFADVRFHLKHICQKLHVHSRTEAALKFRPAK